MSNNEKNKFYGVNDDLWGHKWGFKDSSFIINDDMKLKTKEETHTRFGFSNKTSLFCFPF